MFATRTAVKMPLISELIPPWWHLLFRILTRVKKEQENSAPIAIFLWERLEHFLFFLLPLHPVVLSEAILTLLTMSGKQDPVSESLLKEMGDQPCP